MKRRTPIGISANGAAPRKRRRRIETVLVVLGCVLLADALIGERGLVATRRARQTYDAKEQELHAAETDYERLTDQLHRLTDDRETIEGEARELGLIKPGEKLFIIQDIPPTSQTP